jgi:hypothetical protein
MQRNHLVMAAAGLAVAAGAAALWSTRANQATVGAANLVAAGAPQGITVSWQVPDTLPQNPSLADAAAFAWQEFIALNWPAVPQTGALGTRDTPDQTRLFGDTLGGPLVWHTYRSKVEIFPGTGTPPGYTAGAAADYGYDSLPRYVYARPVSGGSGSTPWINLDENSEIGVSRMFAGVADGAPLPTGGQFLYTAKANRTHYGYVAANRYFDPTVTGPVFAATANYVATNRASPPPETAGLASFPYGTIETKAAWRQLTSAEVASGRFYQTRVRYYEATSSGDTVAVDTVFGLAALHIIQKTAAQPFFVFATFEQADNLLTADGQAVEDREGRILVPSANPLDSMIVSVNAVQPMGGQYDTSRVQHLSPAVSGTTPGSRLYYINTPDQHLPEGNVSLNGRIHPIPDTIIDANQAAHEAIRGYIQANGLSDSVWLNYKLVNVQYVPIDKAAGVTYDAANAGTYYQANSVVETDYILQVFSGQFQPSFTYPSGDTTAKFSSLLITDWNADGTPFKNVQAGGSSYNMGGCMGCHGNAQHFGSDFSFILLGGPVPRPDVADPVPFVSARFLRTVGRKQ